MCQTSAGPSTAILRYYNLTDAETQVEGKQWEARQRKRTSPVCVSHESSVCSDWAEQCFACAGTKQIGQGDPVRVWEDRCSQSAMISLSAFHHPSLLTYAVYSLDVSIPHVLQAFRSFYDKLRPRLPRLTQHFLFEENDLNCVSRHMKHENRPCVSFP